MRFKIVSLVLLLLPCCCFSQRELSIDQLDQVAGNVGGSKEFKRFFNQEVIYPEKSLKEKIKGKVVLKFIIKTDGSTADVKIIKSVNPEIDAEALRLFRYLQWIPSIYKKEKMDSYVTIEFKFKPHSYEKICRKRGYKKPNPPQMPVDTSMVIYEKPEKPPVYYEGDFALEAFIKKNLEYPKPAILQNIKGTVILSFVVETTGRMSNITIKESLGAGCDQQAARVLALTQ